MTLSASRLARTYPRCRGADGPTRSRRARAQEPPSTPCRSRFRLELVGEPLCPGVVVSQEQRERRFGSPEPAGGVDPRREPEPDRALVARRRVDVRDAHERPQPRLLRLGQPPQAGERERAVLVEEGDDVGDGRERDEVEVPVEERMPGAEERLGELPHDAGPAEAGERHAP
jgi:hypothetical protein